MQIIKTQTNKLWFENRGGRISFASSYGFLAYAINFVLVHFDPYLLLDHMSCINQFMCY